MPLSTTVLNEMVTGIKNSLAIVRPVAETYTTITGYLGNDISIDPNPTTITAPATVSMDWSSVSGGEVQSSNTPAAATQLNFAVYPSNTANSVIFLNGNLITGVMQLASSVVGGTYGKGLYLEFVKITISEVVV